MNLAAAMDKIYELEEMVNALKAEQVPISTREWAREVLGLSKFQSEIFAAIISRPVASRRAIEAALYTSRNMELPDANCLTVQVYKIRKKMPDWIKIETVHGDGYSVNEFSRRAVRKAVNEWVESYADI